MLSQVTERAQTACCHASEVVCQSEAPEQSEDRGVVRGDGDGTAWFRHAPDHFMGVKIEAKSIQR